MTPPADVPDRIRALPLGTCRGSADGKRYVTTRSQFCAGRVTKVVAEELGGKGYISLNFYELAPGAQLYPCEMLSAKVITFVRDFSPDESGSA